MCLLRFIIRLKLFKFKIWYHFTAILTNIWNFSFVFGLRSLLNCHCDWSNLVSPRRDNCLKLTFGLKMKANKVDIIEVSNFCSQLQKAHLNKNNCFTYFTVSVWQSNVIGLLFFYFHKHFSHQQNIFWQAKNKTFFSR